MKQAILQLDWNLLFQKKVRKFVLVSCYRNNLHLNVHLQENSIYVHQHEFDIKHTRANFLFCP